MRFLILAGVIFVVAMCVVRLLKLSSTKKTAPLDPAEAAPTAISEAMLSCSQCGMHFPASEAVMERADLVFCSEEHRARHFAK